MLFVKQLRGRTANPNVSEVELIGNIPGQAIVSIKHEFTNEPMAMPTPFTLGNNRRLRAAVTLSTSQPRHAADLLD